MFLTMQILLPMADMTAPMGYAPPTILGSRLKKGADMTTFAKFFLPLHAPTL
jgi:hypothetical protein